MPRIALAWIALLSVTLPQAPAFAQETLDEALSHGGKEPDTSTAFRLDGFLMEDSDPKRFRLYPEPKNRALYYLIRRQDLAGRPYKWTDSEKVAAGFPGPEARHRIAVEHGATIHVVTMTVLESDDLAQQQVQQMTERENRLFTTLSNLLKAHADIAKNAIDNMR